MQSTKVFVSVGKRSAWIKAPDSGLGMASSNWGAMTQLVNGGMSGVASRLSSRLYSLSWSYLKRADFEAIDALFSEAGEDRVLYLDPFAKSNVLSKLGGHPYLLAESFSKLAWDINGVEQARVADLGQEPYKGLQVIKATGEPYVESVAVPAGYSITIVRNGSDLVRYRWEGSTTFTKITSGAALTPPAGVGVIEIEFGNGVGTLNWVRAVVHKTGTPPTDVTTYAPPRGGGNMMVVPGSYQVSGINAVYGEYSASVELQEVWAWQ